MRLRLGRRRKFAFQDEPDILMIPTSKLPFHPQLIPPPNPGVRIMELRLEQERARLREEWLSQDEIPL